MNLHYMILAHRQPEQVRRLIEKLQGDRNFFYIHIDKGADAGPFKTTLRNLPHVQFCAEEDREYGTWGDIGIVKATLHMLRRITGTAKEPGYCILLSGQDYPIRSAEQIRSYLGTHYGTDYISCFPLPSADWNNGGMERLTWYKINISNRRGDFVLCPSVLDAGFFSVRTAKKIVRILRGQRFIALGRILEKRRPFPDYLRPYGGDQWWALTIETAGKVLDFLDRHPDYLAFHEDTLLPDESFFQSVVQQLHTESPLRIRPSLTYVNWQRKNVPLPVTFRLEDLEELTGQPPGKLFARKFDAGEDLRIFHALDRQMAGHDAVA